MIDIHSHILHGVDDGCKSIDEAIKLIEEEIRQGVTDIILTPHYRLPHYHKSLNEVNSNYIELCNRVKELSLNVNLYLGREIHYNKNTIERLNNGRFESIANSSYYLLEFSYNDYTEIDEVVYKLNRLNKKVIIAHIERYKYIKSIDDYYQIRSMGALIQVNASTICGKNSFLSKHLVFRLIKEGLVDFVASDIHSSRVNYMEKAYNIVLKKFGEKVASDLFYNNARALLLESGEVAA